MKINLDYFKMTALSRAIKICKICGKILIIVAMRKLTVYFTNEEIKECNELVKQ